MTTELDELPKRWGLVPGAVLQATPEGLSVIGRRAVHVDLGSRALERRFLEWAAAGGEQRALDHMGRGARRAVAELERLGALGCSPSACVADLLPGAGPLPLASSLRPGKTLAVIADSGDVRIGEWTNAAREARAMTLLAWVSQGSVTVVHDDGGDGPCVECALLFDAEVARAAALSGAAYAEGWPEVAGDAAPAHGLARAIMHGLLSPGALLPRPGHAMIIDTRSLYARRARYVAHPSCGCRRFVPTLRALPGRISWNRARSERFAPLVALSNTRASGRAEVAFRGSRSPWPDRSGGVGTALACGPAARNRALAEGVKRFCALHTPPDVVHVAASDLSEPRLAGEDIVSLLYRPQEQETPGFRMAAYRDDTPLDWSWARNPLTGERRLVPTSLVGRPSTGAHLTETTSSGYATDRSADLAALRAVLETVERDAVLAAWYLRLPVAVIDQRCDAAYLRRGIITRAFCATQDVALPVVWLLALDERGALTSASAAGTSFDSAWAAAWRDLDTGLGMDRATATEASVLSPVARAGPADHRYFYAEALRGRAGFEHPNAAGHVSPESLRRRWPARSAEELNLAVAAVAGAGLGVWLVERSLPAVFGPEWTTFRALIPGSIELSWGQPYRRLASPRVSEWLRIGYDLSEIPHPIGSTW